MKASRFVPVGDSAVNVEFGNEISVEINSSIRALDMAIEASGVKGVTETVPTYRSLLVYYDFEKISYKKLVSTLEKLLDEQTLTELPAAEVLEVPVLYGGEMGPDIKFVAENAGVSEAEVIKMHTEPDYLIYMLGFTPGFTYLGGLNEKIHTPRLQKPRVKIDAGSVGIAGGQTGIYPIDSPGGWQLIGRTPVKMYDPEREEPVLPKAGQYIHFFSIDQKEYDRIKALVEKGEYKCEIHPKEERK